jgi:hypothetical protein
MEHSHPRKPGSVTKVQCYIVDTVEQPLYYGSPENASVQNDSPDPTISGLPHRSWMKVEIDNISACNIRIGARVRTSGRPDTVKIAVHRILYNVISVRQILYGVGSRLPCHYQLQGFCITNMCSRARD